MRPFALDLSDTILRLLTLEKTRNAWRLPVRAEIAVPEGMIVDGEIRQGPAVIALLKDLIKASGVKERQVIVSLPERHTFVKLISVAVADGGDRQQAIKDEATLHLPYSWDEVYFDFYQLPKKNSHGQIQVVFGAAPRAIVDSYLAVFDAAGLEVINLVIESLAIARAIISPTAAAGTFIILDLGRTRSTIILVNDGVVQLSATVRYAGKELNRYIADELKITIDQAERAKTIFGLDPKRGKGLLRHVLAPHIDTLAEKIKEIEDFYVEHFIDTKPVSAVYLTGSGAMLRHIDTELQSRLQQSVHIQPSWVVESARRADDSIDPATAYTYVTVAGLALENFAAFL